MRADFTNPRHIHYDEFDTFNVRLKGAIRCCQVPMSSRHRKASITPFRTDLFRAAFHIKPDLTRTYVFKNAIIQVPPPLNLLQNCFALSKTPVPEQTLAHLARLFTKFSMCTVIPVFPEPCG